MWQYQNTDELYHYGVLGMRWGHRKSYYNSDGSLNDLGRQRISKKYNKYMQKANKRILNRDVAVNITANKTFKQLNKDKNLRKKVGTKEYDDILNKKVAENFNKEYYKKYTKNRYYKKAQKLVNKYNMRTFDKLAIDNEKKINSMKNNNYLQYDLKRRSLKWKYN